MQVDFLIHPDILSVNSALGGINPALAILYQWDNPTNSTTGAELTLAAQHDLGPTLTLARTSEASCRDDEDYLRVVGAGDPRFTGSRIVTNTCSRSQDFTDGEWTKVGISCTANATTDPLGGSTGAKFLMSGSGDQYVYNDSETHAFLDRTISVYLREGTHPYVALGDANGTVWCVFDLSDGTIGTQTNGTSYITDVGGGWYRCEVVVANTRNSNTLMITGAAAKDSSNGVDSTDSTYFYVWGAQVERNGGASSKRAQEYVVTTGDDIVTKSYFTSRSGAALTPRGLLLEEAKTNICPYSQNINTGYIFIDQGAKGTNTTEIDPAGRLASVLTDDGSDPSGTSQARCTILLNGIAASTTYTATRYVKKKGMDWYKLQIGSMGSLAAADVYFDLDTGAIGTVGGDVTTAFMEDAGNGWYRCGFSFLSDASDVNVQFQDFVSYADGNVNCPGDGNSDLYFGPSQLEVGGFPSSYIENQNAWPTSTTRNAESLSTADATSAWGNTSATAYFRGDSIGPGDGENTLFVFADADSSDVLKGRINNGTPAFVGYSSAAVGNTGILNNSGNAVLNTSFRMAQGIEEDNYTMWISGTVDSSPDTDCGMPQGITTLNLGDSGADDLNGHISEFRYYNVRQPDSAMLAMSNGTHGIEQ